MYVNIRVLNTRAAVTDCNAKTLQNHLVAYTWALLPPTDSIPRHRRSDVAVGVVDDLSARRVGTRPRSRCGPIARGSPSPPRALSIGSADKQPVDRSIRRRGVAERVAGERARGGFRFILIAGASPAVSRSRISRRYNTRTRVSFTRGDGHPP